MTLHQLKVFLTIVKLNGVAQAAKALHISQPSVSGVIQDLQNELGVKLFERFGNRRKLTEIGKRLFERAETALNVIDGMREEVEEYHGLKKGKIVVGGSALAAASFLPIVIQSFKRGHPGVDVVMKIDKSNGLERDLISGEIDVAIMSWIPCSPRFYSEPYLNEEVMVIAAPKHPLSKKRSVTLEEASKEPWIAYKVGYVRGIVDQIFADRALQFKPTLEVDLQLGARDAIKSVVMNNICIGYLSKYHVLSELKTGRLKALKIEGFPVERTLHLVLHKNQMDSPHIQAFLKFLRTHKPQGSERTFSLPSA